MFSRYLQSVLKGTVGTIVFYLLGMTVLSVIITKFSVDKNILNFISLIILLFSLSIGSIVAAKKNNKNGWLVGIGVAVFYYFVLGILLSLINGNIIYDFMSIWKFLMLIIVGSISGVLGINL